MGIISKTTKVKLWGKNMKLLLDLGYQGKKGDIIDVKIEHLNKYSKALIEVRCDYCGCIKTITFMHYNNCKHSNGLYACTHCVGYKCAETNLDKYGVLNVSQLQETKEKVAFSNIERYGVANVFQSEKHKEKIKRSMNEKYGVDKIMQSEYGKEKMKSTCNMRYGVDNPAKVQSTKDKMASTNTERYGGVAPSKSLEVKEKMAQTLYKNGTTPTSKQQLYIFNFYKSINPAICLNFPIAYYNVDICFPEEKLVIEYDGGFHNGDVQIGNLTQEEFNHKELIRDKVIKSEDYKIIRIKSMRDRLPQDQILLRILSESRNYFLTTSHTWQIYDIDQSLLFNAENKQGIPYSFGTLRTIKDSDLNLNTTTAQAV